MEKKRKPTLVLISGPSGSGKTTLSNKIIASLPRNLNAIVISQDDFYKNKKDIPKIKNMINYDHPDAFDWKLTKKTLNDIIARKKVEIRKYDFTTNKHTDKKIIIPPDLDVVIFEGLFSMYNNQIRAMASLTVFIETQLDECIIRRILRDIHERGRNIDNVIMRWREIVKPMYKLYIEPLKYNADVIIPWDEGKKNSVKLITSGIVKSK